MVESLSSVFSELDFREYHYLLLDNSYYDIVFPFLLLFALLYTVLSFLKVFQSKKTGEPFSSIISVIAIIISWYGVNFELSPGRNVGGLVQLMFPNISALTIGILMLYLVGSLFGKDFFNGLFPKDKTSFIYIALGGIGASAVVFYTGISMGLWEYNVFDKSAYWNFFFAAILLVLGIVFLFADLLPLGIIFLIVFAVYIGDGASGNVVDYFIDPVIFIVVLFTVLFSWVTSDRDGKRAKLRRALYLGQEALDSYKTTPRENKARIYDITKTSFDKNEKEWKKYYGDENWK